MTTVNATTTTVGTAHPLPEQQQIKKNKHVLLPQQQLTTEKSQQVAKDGLGTSSMERNDLENLKERASCLSQENDKVFKTAIKNAIFFLNGFTGTLKGDNLDYKSDETNGLSAELRTHYRMMKEKDHKNYVETAAKTDQLQLIVQSRITALKEATLRAQFEAELLTQACVGKESNFTTTFLARDYKYGIPYRLSEARQALDTRSKKLPIQETDKADLQNETVEEKPSSESSSEVLPNLNTLLAKIVSLKEVVTVYSEAFKLGQFASFKKLVYFAHLNFFTEFKKSFDEMEDSITKHLEQLNTSIERESLNQDSVLLPSLKFEKLAIENNIARMTLRLKETAKFLESYKVDESEKPSEVKVKVLGSEGKAVNLLRQIVSLKENILRDNGAEAELSIEKRKQLYSAASRKLTEVTTTATEMKKTYEGRVKELTTQARGYLTTIEKLEAGIAQLQHGLKGTAEATRERLQWKLEEEIKQEGSIPQETSSGGFFSYLASWRKGTSQEVSTVTSQPSTNEPPSTPLNHLEGEEQIV